MLLRVEVDFSSILFLASTERQMGWLAGMIPGLFISYDQWCWWWSSPSVIEVARGNLRHEFLRSYHSQIKP